MPGLTQVSQLIPLPEVKAAVSQLFLEKEKYFLRTESKNLLNDGKGVLKLEEIMWTSDYV
jgi:hypothetical protein